MIQQIQQQSPNVAVSYIQCDLCDNASIKKAAEQVKSLVDGVDVLINNAGVMAVRSFQLSTDGVETQLAAGYLGHFLLTNLLKDKILAARGIVLNITSSAYTLAEVDTDDPNFEAWNSDPPSKSALIHRGW